MLVHRDHIQVKIEDPGHVTVQGYRMKMVLFWLWIVHVTKYIHSESPEGSTKLCCRVLGAKVVGATSSEGFLVWLG